MRVTVERIDTHLVAVAPGLSAMQIEVGVDPRMVVIRCPRCRQRTEHYLVEGDQFEIRHRQKCRLERAIRRSIEAHPDLAWKGARMVVFPGGARSRRAH